MVDGVVPAEKIREYQTDPALQDKHQHLRIGRDLGTSFNLAVPPFDDVHVRKAVSWAFDKQGFRSCGGGLGR